MIELNRQSGEEVRPLELNDVGRMLEILEKAYEKSAWPIGGGWNYAQLKASLQKGDGVGLFVPGFGLAAFIIFHKVFEIYDITVLATDPERQRQGDMKHLLSLFLENLQDEDRVWLEVHEANLAARRLYEGMGFQRRGRRTRYYRDGADALVYSFG